MMEEEKLISDADDEERKKYPPPKGLFQTRYVFAVLASLGFVNVYAMRINLSISMVAMINKSAIAQPNISHECASDNNTSQNATMQDGEFIWDQYTQGIILGSFFWGYIITQLPAGRFAELYGGKWIFGAGILCTSVLTLLTPLAARMGEWYLIALRVLEGFGEGVTFPAMHIMISRWSPPNERSRMVAFIQTGSLLGTVIGLPLSGYLIIHGFAGGWPSVFYVFGIAGIVWFVFWSVLAYDSPQQHPWISYDEKEYISRSLGLTSEFVRSSKPFPWRKAVKSVPVWALIIAHFGNNWGFYTLLTELPTYLHTVLNFDMNKNSFLSALPYFLSWVIGMVASTSGDYLTKNKHLSVTATRKFFHGFGQVFPALFLIGITQVTCNQMLSFALLVIAMATSGATYGGYSINHIDIASNFAGTLLGITNTIATIPGWMGPYVVGAFTQGHPDRKEWNNVFYLSSGIYLISAVVFSVFGSGVEQPWNSDHSEERDNLEKAEAKKRRYTDLKSLGI